jgi:adenylyltransferase/sulfurtransferase
METNKINISDDRYSRFEIIHWWDQDILKNAKIMVIGCGALGNEIIKNLTMLGAGNIYAVDMDKVERSNLSRSVLFRKEDEGKSKAETVCRRAKEINDEINISYYNGSIFGLGLGVFAQMDLVICGLDNREARLFVNQSCWKVNKPWIDGAIEVLNGVARMFIPPEGICYECTMTEMDYKLMNRRKSCMLLGIEDIDQGKIPTTPTIASVIGGVQVQEAVKYLHKREDLLLLNGKGFIFNGSINDSYIIEYQQKDDCPSHYTFGTIETSGINFSAVRLKDVINSGKKFFGEKEFHIDFNNEVVYGLENEETGEKEEFFSNMNMLKQDDIKRNGKLSKICSLHSLSSGSELCSQLAEQKLSELKIPLNDILTLRGGSKEVYLGFEYSEAFNNCR